MAVKSQPRVTQLHVQELDMIVWFREACATQDFFARRAVRRPAEWRNGEVAAEAFHGRAGSARSANSRRAPVAARRGRELGTRRC